jgi:hypothetical protein
MKRVGCALHACASTQETFKVTALTSSVCRHLRQACMRRVKAAYVTCDESGGRCDRRRAPQQPQHTHSGLCLAREATLKQRHPAASVVSVFVLLY